MDNTKPSSVEQFWSTTEITVNRISLMHQEKLIALVDLEVLGSIWIGCRWFRGDEGEWIALPMRNYGKRWIPVIAIRDKNAFAIFQTRALEAVRDFLAKNRAHHEYERPF